MSPDQGRIELEVVFALPDQQPSVRLSVAPGTTIREAIDQSGVLKSFPGWDPAQLRVGRWNRLAALDDTVNAGDRVEIYRPLQIDPKQARKLRAGPDRRGR